MSLKLTSSSRMCADSSVRFSASATANVRRLRPAAVRRTSTGAKVVARATTVCSQKVDLSMVTSGVHTPSMSREGTVQTSVIGGGFAGAPLEMVRSRSSTSGSGVRVVHDTAKGPRSPSTEKSDLLREKGEPVGASGKSILLAVRGREDATAAGAGDVRMRCTLRLHRVVEMAQTASAHRKGSSGGGIFAIVGAETAMAAESQGGIGEIRIDAGSGILHCLPIGDAMLAHYTL